MTVLKSILHYLSRSALHSLPFRQPVGCKRELWEMSSHTTVKLYVPCDLEPNELFFSYW